MAAEIKVRNMSKQSPLQRVNETYGSKDKLVERLVGLLEAGNGESQAEHKARLRLVSNAKLLHLLGLGERAKELGGKDAIVAKIADLRGQAKDHEFVDSLKRCTLGKLVDLHDALGRRVAGKAKKKAPRQQRKRRNRTS